MKIMRKLILTAALLAASCAFVSAKDLYPLSGDGASGQYNTKMDPAMGDGALGNQTRVLPSEKIFVGQAGELGSAYLLAFETTPEVRTAASEGKLSLELPLVGKTGDGAKVTVLLLGGSKPVSESKWARFRSWNVASGYTIVGHIPETALPQSYTFEIDWAEKGIWTKNPIAWFAVFVEQGNFKGDDNKMIFSGQGPEMPKLVIAE